MMGPEEKKKGSGKNLSPRCRGRQSSTRLEGGGESGKDMEQEERRKKFQGRQKGQTTHGGRLVSSNREKKEPKRRNTGGGPAASRRGCGGRTETTEEVDRRQAQRVKKKIKTPLGGEARGGEAGTAKDWLRISQKPEKTGKMDVGIIQGPRLL